ncbi:S8 family peptidase [Elioraea sp. Yellowstone]|uniref:S8 family peptidase n=1 Tax=Elioraea sp. Yellowstone TaxID=2592070 RepID=UPI00114DEA91|nr:S8 family peptidase [Elioraea sp. Yellowstone]TQF78654.1 S8 family peptidase [Elioraea sp. Yellowstone]
MTDLPRDRPHLHIEGGGQSETYTSPRTVRQGLPPARARAAHAARLERAIGTALAEGRRRIAARETSIAEGEPGFYLEFDIPVAERAAVEGLENKPKAIELVAVRPPAEGDEMVTATVFVPERSADFFVKKIEAYRDEDTKKGRPKNQNLIARIEDVRLGAVRSLFTDSMELFPAGGRQTWWEVWLRDGRLATFQRVAARLSVALKEHAISFPERDVVIALADEATMARLIENSDAVAELRIAKDTPTLFQEMHPVEQADWARDLAGRVIPPSVLAPVVCLLDSGATQAHPLIAPGLDPVDQHAYDDAWGVGDSAYWNGHGTAMAGVALYGDLEAALANGGAVELGHGLETVKILPPAGQNDPDLYGAITALSIGKAEAKAPRRRRVFCMAVTSEVGLGRGRPSSWSAAVDQLCYGGGDRRRLMVLAAGNLRGDINAGEYPDRNDLEEAENPAQAWNPLVVGAYTDKITITQQDYAGWEALAPAGDLSPSSRTSGIWDRQWPIRPDVVFEGGNCAHDGVNPAVAIDDLQLLTTHYRPNRRLFQEFGDTSAASALGAHLAAGIMTARPELWPETVRGLVVHSAEWTPAMRARFEAAGSQQQKLAMLRRYGWGVPDLGRALLSASNDATLMVEDALLPFRKDGSTIKTRDMHLHQLPWPREELLALGEQDVELRVTLSYFIEPNPGERGWTRRHRYASHSLRFAVKRSLESLSAFRQRINKAALAEESGEARGSGGGDGWLLGTIRDRGSIHSDIWRGSAAALAERDAIGVFPISGWWKEKPGLQRWDRSVRYSLLISIRAPAAETDIYTAIANQIAVAVPISS